MILDSIIENKKKEVEQRKKEFRIEEPLDKSTLNFKKAISDPKSIIAEIKRKSPSTGALQEPFDMKSIIAVYDSHPAVKAISVLTDEHFFGMSPASLQEVANYTKKPLLRKEFIIDEYQIRESRYYGADAILLIASLLPKPKLNRFIKKAKALGMDAVVEVHTKKELDKVLQTEAEIIGINNRNLDTLGVDLETTNMLVQFIPPEKVIVSESGYTTKEEIRKAKADAFLIGTTLLRANNVKQKLDELTR